MTSLDKAREGRNAARQLRSMMDAGCTITAPELRRLLGKIDAGFDQMMGPATPPPAPGRGFAPVVHDGGRR